MSHNNLSRKHRSRLSTPVRLCVAAVAACFIATPVLSNPVNPTVVNGAATFNQVGNLLTVTNSNGAIINWDKFSIKVGETTHFAQTAASSTVLNRVLNDPTTIYGTLSSNGRVWLVNPAGIMVGAGGRVDVAGFVASTLNISNENFLAGRNLFINDGSAGNVINQGEIRTPAGGSVYLIGSNVSNEGIITTPNGETILAAGNTVSLIDSALPGVKVDITGATGNATNLGTITAEAGRIGIAGVIVRNSGQINASSVVAEGGRIFLKASKDAYVDGNGRIVTTGTRGGNVEVLGDRVAVMDNAEIDASGTNSGGRIMVGGDYQGKNPDIQNASITWFGPNASLKADASGVGAGGTVIVWSDDTTRAYGNISARGGALGDDGGFVETSGKRYLAVDGIRVDTRAPRGHVGNWLLDPTNLTILNGPGSSDDVVYGGAGIFTTAGIDGSSTVYAGTIETTLGSTGVTLQTDGGEGGGGNITATSVSISSGSSNTLTLAAYGGGSATGNITITNSTFSVYGGVNMLTGWDGSGFTSGDVISGRGDIIISGSTIQSTAGVVNLWAGKDILLSNNGNADTRVQGAGMDVRAGHDLKLTSTNNYGGSLGPFGPGVMLYSTGAQTVTAVNEINLTAGNTANSFGSGNSQYGGSVVIMAGGNQFVSADTIKLAAGAAGNDNAAAIIGATQEITVTSLLDLKGGGGGNNNYAWIGATSGNQTIYGGTTANIVLTGGTSGGAPNYANSADIGLGQSNTGGSRTVYAGSITINGGGNSTTYGGAGFGTDNGNSQSFYVANDLTMTGGSNAGDSRATAAYIGSEYGGGSITIKAGGNVSVYGGSGTGGLAMIGTVDGGPTTIDIGAYGGIVLSSGVSGVAIGNMAQSPYGGAGVSLFSKGGIDVTGTADAPVMIGSLYGGTATSVTLGSERSVHLTHARVGNEHAGAASVSFYAGSVYLGGSSPYGGNLTFDNSRIGSALGDAALSFNASYGGVGTGNISFTDSGAYGASIAVHADKDLTLRGVSSGVRLQTTGSNGMTITADNLYAYGGDAINPAGANFFGMSTAGHGAGVLLWADVSEGVRQAITVTNSIVLQAGSANNTVYAGSPMYGGSVVIKSDADQTISANVIKLYAGASGHDNAAEIQAYGGQIINIATGAASPQLELRGGGGGNANYANINAYGTNTVQTIYANGASINLYGGTSGGAFDFENSADIGLGQLNTGGSRTVYAGSITINGGSAAYGGAGFGTHNGLTQSFYVTGDLTMNGGSTNNADFRATTAYIGSEYGGGTIDLRVGGDIKLYGGSGTAGGVMIGGLDNLNGPTTVRLNAGKSITATGNTGGVWLGVKNLTGSFYGSSVALKAGWNADGGEGGGAPSGFGGDITLAGPVHIQTDATSGTVNVVAYESSTGVYGGVSLGSGTSVYGNSIDIIGAGNIGVDGTLVSTNGLNFHAGSQVNFSPSQYGGNLTLGTSSSLSATGIVYLNASVGTGDSTTGNIDVASGVLSIPKVDINGKVDARILTVTANMFTLSGGTWSQVVASLPGFTVSDFRLAAGTTFVRALDGNGNSGTPYRLADIHGVQGTGSTGMLGKYYVLANDIDAAATSGWNAGAGFMPIGTSPARFTGQFDGLGHTISNLAINRPAEDYVGLFGFAGSGNVLRNVGLLGGAVTGHNNVGQLVGLSDAGTLSNVHATGNVTGNQSVGGLLGHNNYGTISNAYASGNVSGATDAVGGLAGRSYGQINNAYATGNVSGTSEVGGLVGYNNDHGHISNTYATGSVSGSSNVGGLVGYTYLGGTVSDSYWNTQTSGQASAVGLDHGTTTATGGLTTVQMMTKASFAGWSIADTGGSGAIWRIYEGNTYPLLRAFLKPLTVTVGGVSKTYDGSAYGGGLSNASYSITSAATDTVHLLNTAKPYDSPSKVNAGSYAPGLYSDQQGYDISYNGGVLTVNPYAVSLTGTRTYDGTANVVAGIFTIGSLVGSETLTLSGAGTVADRHAGTGKTAGQSHECQCRGPLK